MYSQENSPQVDTYLKTDEPLITDYMGTSDNLAVENYDTLKQLSGSNSNRVIKRIVLDPTSEDGRKIIERYRGNKSHNSGASSKRVIKEL